MDDHPSGQASADYVAILAVVLAVLAGAAAVALAVPGVGERVIATVRTGICIVGGDFCRTADAEAAGLAPCLTEARSEREATTLDIAVVRLGEDGDWQIALRSDGSATVTRLAHSELGGTVGIGLELNDLEASASGALVAGYRGGRAWHFPDAGSARAFLVAAIRDDAVLRSRKPDVTWHALTQGAGAEVAASLHDLAKAGLATEAGSALGVRAEGTRRTLTLEVGTVDPYLFAELAGASVSSGTERYIVADVTWEGGEARELVLRSAVGSGDRLDELSARLDLRNPETRMLAERVLRAGSTSADLRALAVHAADHGIVERTGYAVSEHRNGFDVAARAGLSLGLEHEKVTAERRLVEAVAWVRGGPPQRRFDCLGP